MRKAVVRTIAVIGLLAGAGVVQAENLQEIYKQAVESDPQLRSAQYAYDAAGDARDQSKAALLPHVNLTANTSQVSSDITDSSVGVIPTGTKSYSTNGYTLSLSQTLYHHEYYAQLRAATAGIDQAKANLDAASQGLILRVAQAYFNLLAAEDNATTAEAQKTAVGQQLRQTKQRFEVGLSAITDVHEAQAGYDAAVAQVITAQNGVDTAREALREITGSDYKDVNKLGDQLPLDSPEPADINKWVAKALDQNLQLAAAEAAAEAARQQVEAARAGHYPSIDLVASHSYTDSLKANFGTKNTANNISLQLNLPLYSGGGTSAGVRAALAQYNQAQEQVVQLRRSVVLQTRDAYLGVTAGISQVAARKQALASAQTALDATQAGFQVGTRTAVDVLNAQNVKSAAETAYAKSRYDYVLAMLKLKQAAGNLSEKDVAMVNSWLK